MFYDDIYKDFLLLPPEGKKQKLIMILENFKQEEFYQETINLLNEEPLDLDYLDLLYEGIMKPLSKSQDQTQQLEQIKLSLKNLHLSILENKHKAVESILELE